MDYYRDWMDEFYTWTHKYKYYWRGGFRDFGDDSDEENYGRVFLPPNESPLSYTVEDLEFLRNQPQAVSKDCEFFSSLVNDTKQVIFDVVGTGTTFRYIIVEVGGKVERPEITVLSSEGVYMIWENSTYKKVYNKKEDAGAYILKWILEHID